MFIKWLVARSSQRKNKIKKDGGSLKECDKIVEQMHATYEIIATFHSYLRLGDVCTHEQVIYWIGWVVDNSNFGKTLKEKELDEQDLNNLQNIIVNAKIKIKKNDMDLIVVENKLCQMQYENGKMLWLLKTHLHTTIMRE